MLGPIGSHLLASLKVMTPSEVERVARSTRADLIQEPQALEEEAVSFDEGQGTKVLKLKSKKEEAQKEKNDDSKGSQKENKKNEKKIEKSSLAKEDLVLDDSIIFIEEWAKSKHAKKKMFGLNGMKVYDRVSNYEPIQVNSQDEDDIIISTGTSGILINKKQS